MTSGGNVIEPTGVAGFDAILSGGLVAGQPVLLRGGAGSGKTQVSLNCMLGQPDRSAVFATFDEDPDRIREYAARFGETDRLRVLDFRQLGPLVHSGGSLELGGLLPRLEFALDQTGSHWLVLDAVDSLFDDVPDAAGVRSALQELFAWARRRGLVLICTAGEAASYRPATSLLDYASDCVVHLTQNLDNGLNTRNLRVIKCRGRAHGTNEYPFIIDHEGVSISAITVGALTYPAPGELVSTGVPALDDMLGGGYRERGTVLVSGTSGTGKSLLALTLANQACSDGRRVVYTSFEESPAQAVTGAASIGLDLTTHLDSGRLDVVARRAVELTVDQHLMQLVREIEHHHPDLMVIDPISSLFDIADQRSYKNFVLLAVNYCKAQGVGLVLTELLPERDGGSAAQEITSLTDTWIELGRVHDNGEFNRLVSVKKSRGAASSNRVMELVIGDAGLTIEAPYVRGDRMLYGWAKSDARSADERSLEVKQQVVDSLTAEVASLETSNSERHVSGTVERIVSLRERLLDAERDLSELRRAVGRNPTRRDDRRPR